MSGRLKSCGLLVLLALVFLGGMSAGAFLDQRFFLNLNFPSQAAASAQSFNPNLIKEAWDKINQSYVDRQAVDGVRLTYGAISGMMDTLGDTGHTTFLTPDMLKLQRNFTQGSFEGIGAQVSAKDGRVVIVAPMDGSPAQKAGVKPGDIIMKVDGIDTEGKSISEVVSHILGKDGTSVTITLQDPTSGDLRDVTIIRARIDVHNVTWQMLPGTRIAHVRLVGFSQNVTDDLVKALNEIQKQGGEGLILDLRNNPGGLLDEAIGTASQFLAKGDVLQVKNAQGKVQSIAVNPGGVATTIPMVVLVNPGTASASEIVSGALQDARRAKVVGEKTFGTGTVLREFPLSDGSALLLATEEWLTPKGRVIWHQGIQPDVPLTLPKQVIPLTPESERQLSAQELKASQDVQLLKAIELLSKMASAPVQ